MSTTMGIFHKPAYWSTKCPLLLFWSSTDGSVGRDWQFISIHSKLVLFSLEFLKSSSSNVQIGQNLQTFSSYRYFVPMTDHISIPKVSQVPRVELAKHLPMSPFDKFPKLHFNDGHPFPCPGPSLDAQKVAFRSCKHPLHQQKFQSAKTLLSCDSAGQLVIVGDQVS